MTYRLLLFISVFFIFLLFGCITGPVQVNNSNGTGTILDGNETNGSNRCSSPGLDKIAERKCYYDHAYETGDASVCEKIDLVSEDLGYSKGSCYLQVARKNANSSICDVIPENPGGPTKQIKNLCYYEVAAVSKNASICDKMTDDYEFYCPPCPAGAMCKPCAGPYTRELCKINSA